MGNKCVNYVLVIYIYIYVVTKIFYNKSKVVNIEAPINVIKEKIQLINVCKQLGIISERVKRRI